MTSPRRVLVVDDDEALARAIADQLRDAGYVVDNRYDGLSGFESALHGDYDVIVLDIMLPKRNGFSVCLDLREAGVETPLLFLTAKDGELDEIEGLEVGADDFLRKPFERSILLARINSAVRRNERGRPTPLQIGPVVIDTSRQVVKRNDIEVALTPREYRLLEYLVSRLNEPVAKGDILTTVWGASFDGDPNIVEVYVGYVRRKLDRVGAPSLITTLRGVGYTVSSS